MRILFALPGLHRVDRGAEVAFLAVASELARGGDQVTLIGSGPPRPDRPYRYIHVPAIRRERFERLPALPLFRSETAWEDATFAPGLLRTYDPADYDITITCSFPFTNWALRRPSMRGSRPPHVFVTQNGDWPAFARKAEFRTFACDGLVCINPDYFDRNKVRYRSALIPNGVDIDRFSPGKEERKKLGLPIDKPIILMVSAMIATKNVDRGILAVSKLPDAVLIVAGDGPERAALQKLADEHLPGRYHQMMVAAEEMPALYRSADVVLHLSQNESFGNLYVEAMACGTPIVAYDSARTRWILGELGYLGAPDADGAIAIQIELALKAGPKWRTGLVARAKDFRWSQIAKQYRSFFEDVMANAKC